jgi:hypothetical protein
MIILHTHYYYQTTPRTRALNSAEVSSKAKITGQAGKEGVEGDNQPMRANEQKKKRKV